MRFERQKNQLRSKITNRKMDQTEELSKVAAPPLIRFAHTLQEKRACVRPFIDLRRIHNVSHGPRFSLLGLTPATITDQVHQEHPSVRSADQDRNGPLALEVEDA